jgi:hypothetical protein
MNSYALGRILRTREFSSHWFLGRIRDRIVGIATGYRLDDRVVGVQVSVGSRIFSSPRPPDRGVKRPGLEADRTPPARAEVNKMYIPLHAFVSYCLMR